MNTCPDPKVILQAFDAFRATLVATGIEPPFEPAERASAMSVAAATTPTYLEAAADAAERGGGKLGPVLFDVERARAVNAYRLHTEVVALELAALAEQLRDDIARRVLEVGREASRGFAVAQALAGDGAPVGHDPLAGLKALRTRRNRRKARKPDAAATPAED